MVLILSFHTHKELFEIIIISQLCEYELFNTIVILITVWNQLNILKDSERREKRNSKRRLC